jgi:hypothetical protein
MAGYDWVGGLLGRAPQEYDPYKQDRQLRMQALSQGMGNYDAMMSTPGGAIPQSYRDQMLKETENDVRNKYAGQGQSGFTGDRVVRAQNDLRVKMLDTELGQLNKQRDYNAQLIGMSQPTTQQPGQTGVLQKVGSDLMGRAARAGGDAILGQQPDDEEQMRRMEQWRMFGAYGNNTRGGGMNVGGE